MPIMIDKHGNAVDIPQADATLALSLGYVNAPPGVTAGMNKSQITAITSPTPITPSASPALPVIPTTSGSSEFSNLQFKPGLSETQKKQLINRINSIKSGSTITQTDISNFNYGLGDTWKQYVSQSSLTPSTTEAIPQDQSYKTGNSIIDAIVDGISPEQLATTEYKWNDELQNEAKKIAEADFGPYYQRMYETEESQMKAGLEDYQKTYERDIYDTQVRKEQLEDDYSKALQSARRSYAASGLAYSSERTGKETDLRKQLTKGLTAADVALGRTKEDVESAQQQLMAKGELRLGSEGVDPYKDTYKYISPLSERYSGELELDKRKSIAEDIQRQKSNYTQQYA